MENVRNANLFHNRVVNHWNKRPDSVVMAVSVNSFKKRLSSFLDNVGPEFFFLSIVVCVASLLWAHLLVRSFDRLDVLLTVCLFCLIIAVILLLPNKLSLREFEIPAFAEPAYTVMNIYVILTKKTATTHNINQAPRLQMINNNEI